MNNYIFLDLDGTIVRDVDKQVSSYTVDILKRLIEKGYKVCLNTGRPFDVIPDNLKDVNFSYLIMGNGTLITNKQNTLFKSVLDNDEVADIIQETFNYDLLPFCFINGKFTIASKYKNKILNHYKIDTLDKITVYYDDYINAIKDRKNEIFKIALIVKKEEKQLILKTLQKKFPNYCYSASGDDNIEIVSLESNKGGAIRKLIEIEHLSNYQIISVGDNDNDLSMLQEASIRIVPENGNDNAKALATHLCDHCDNDGPAKMLKQLFLKGE